MPSSRGACKRDVAIPWRTQTAHGVFERLGIASPRRLAMTLDLDSAFRATTYRVFVPNAAPIDIRIGECSAPLDALLDSRGCREWAFITAWNPGAKALSAAENAARQSQLLGELRRRGCDWIDGSGIPADASWKAEASVLVLGISAGDAMALGREFGQLAVVTGARGDAAELVYCSAGASPAS